MPGLTLEQIRMSIKWAKLEKIYYKVLLNTARMVSKETPKISLHTFLSQACASYGTLFPLYLFNFRKTEQGYDFWMKYVLDYLSWTRTKGIIAIQDGEERSQD